MGDERGSDECVRSACVDSDAAECRFVKRLDRQRDIFTSVFSKRINNNDFGEDAVHNFKYMKAPLVSAAILILIGIGSSWISTLKSVKENRLASMLSYGITMVLLFTGGMIVRPGFLNRDSFADYAFMTILILIPFVVQNILESKHQARH